MITFDYGDLLSPEPKFIKNIGSIKCPTAREVSKIGFSTYSRYINLLSLSFEQMIELLNVKHVFELLPKEELDKINIFSLIINDDSLIDLYLSVFSFFICEQVVFNRDKQSYQIIRDSELLGEINNRNYNDVVTYILQINYAKENEKPVKYKSKKAKELAERIKLEKEKIAKNKKSDENFTLANIISKLSIFHNSINMLNIWDLTIYQIYDQFYGQNHKNQMDIISMRWSAWGQDEFDFKLWFKSLIN